MIRFIPLAFIILVSCSTANRPAADTANPFENSRQLVVVLSENNEDPSGKLFYFQKKDNVWEPVEAGFDIMLGRTGLAWGDGLHPAQTGPQKREGDGKSPAGIFRFGASFGQAPASEVSWKLPYVQVTATLECVDDSDSKFYNQLVDADKVEKDWNSSERMLEVGAQYAWGVYVEHNNPAEARGGSCIFFHIWKDQDEPTSGCTAMPEEKMLELLQWLDPARQPLLVQVTEPDYRDLQKKFKLPPIL